MRTSKEIIEFLEKNGYKSYPVPWWETKGLVWCGSKSLPSDSPECDTNKQKISFNVDVSDLTIPNPDRTFQSVQIEICAEKKNQWFKLMAYSISFNELSIRLNEIEQYLLMAWKAICK